MPLGGVHAPISVVRMAVGDAYGAKEWREGEGDDEVALRTERIERRICHAVAEFAFRQAERMGAKVFGGPKYTVSPIYEGMLKEEMDAAAARIPTCPTSRSSIDATFALLISSSGAPMVIPALNRDGDILSDLVLRSSARLRAPSRCSSRSATTTCRARSWPRPRTDRPGARREGRREPDGDDPRGRGAALPRGGRGGADGGRAIREACLEAVADGIRTADLGGHAARRDFTDEVIRRTRTKVEVRASL